MVLVDSPSQKLPQSFIQYNDILSYCASDREAATKTSAGGSGGSKGDLKFALGPPSPREIPLTHTLCVPLHFFFLRPTRRQPSISSGPVCTGISLLDCVPLILD